MQYDSEFLVVVYSPVPFSARTVVAGEYIGYHVYQDRPHSWALIKVCACVCVCVCVCFRHYRAPPRFYKTPFDTCKLVDENACESGVEERQVGREEIAF